MLYVKDLISDLVHVVVQNPLFVANTDIYQVPPTHPRWAIERRSHCELLSGKKSTFHSFKFV